MKSRLLTCQSLSPEKNNKTVNERYIRHGDAPADWNLIASFDDRNHLTVAKSNLDEDYYVQFSAGAIAALKRGLDRRAKPRARSGDLQLDITQMLVTLLGAATNPFQAFMSLCDEFGMKYSSSHWKSV